MSKPAIQGITFSLTCDQQDSGYSEKKMTGSIKSALFIQQLF